MMERPSTRIKSADDRHVRLSVIDVQGRTVSELDISFDPVFPDEGVDVGQAEIPLADILRGADLAPGLFITRVELFNVASGGSRGDVSAAFVFGRVSG